MADMIEAAAAYGAAPLLALIALFEALKAREIAPSALANGGERNG